MFHKTIFGWTVDMALVAVIYLRRKELRASCCCSVFIARLADSDNPSYFGDFSNYSQCQGQSVFAFVFVFVFVIDLYLQNCLLYITSILANSQTYPNVRVNALFIVNSYITSISHWKHCICLLLSAAHDWLPQIIVLFFAARVKCRLLEVATVLFCHLDPLAQSRGNCASS